jgi:hypothetical protein
MNEGFKTHSLSHCVSHSNIKSLFRNRMSVMEKYV